jgi:ubiquinone/menaquinone biosynthesis C-methylase UbiE
VTVIETTDALRDLGDGLRSAIADGDAGAPYDRHARLYDRLIGNRLYNRALWGTSVADYAAFAAEAVAASDGPLLDAGCGTAVFTADVYAGTEREVVLVDRSVGMLRSAAQRLAPGTRVRFVQADLLELPFAPHRFATVACHGVLHVLDDPWAALRALCDQVAPGGALYASMLVTDRGGISGPYMHALHRRGEIASMRSADELAAAARELFGDAANVTRTGAMAWLRASA